MVRLSDKSISDVFPEPVRLSLEDTTDLFELRWGWATATDRRLRVFAVADVTTLLERYSDGERSIVEAYDRTLKMKNLLGNIKGRSNSSWKDSNWVTAERGEDVVKGLTLEAVILVLLKYGVSSRIVDAVVDGVERVDGGGGVAAPTGGDESNDDDDASMGRGGGASPLRGGAAASPPRGRGDNEGAGGDAMMTSPASGRGGDAEDDNGGDVEDDDDDGGTTRRRGNDRDDAMTSSPTRGGGDDDAAMVSLTRGRGDDDRGDDDRGDDASSRDGPVEDDGDDGATERRASVRLAKGDATSPSAEPPRQRVRVSSSPGSVAAAVARNGSPRRISLTSSVMRPAQPAARRQRQPRFADASAARRAAHVGATHGRALAIESLGGSSFIMK